MPLDNEHDRVEERCCPALSAQEELLDFDSYGQTGLRSLVRVQRKTYDKSHALRDHSVVIINLLMNYDLDIFTLRKGKLSVRKCLFKATLNLTHLKLLLEFWSGRG